MLGLSMKACYTDTDASLPATLSRTASAALMILSVPGLVRHLNNVPSVIGVGAIAVLLFFIHREFWRRPLTEGVHHATTERI